MTRLNHQRPALRVADNLARELARLSAAAAAEAHPRSNRKPMPPVPDAAGEALLSLIGAVSAVYDAESDFLSSFHATSKRAAHREQIELARGARDQACDDFLRHLATLQRPDIRATWRWIKRVESDAIARNNLSLLDVLFEEGLKPAISRLG